MASLGDGLPDYPPAARPSTGGDAGELPPRTKGRGRGVVLLILLTLVVLAGVGTYVYHLGVKAGVSQERTAVAASEKAARENKGPVDMQCPDRDSDVAAAVAIKDQPIVVIKDSPTAAQILVMRKSVVVIVQATIAGDLIVCGDDAAVALEVPLSSLTSRLNIVGGHDKTVSGTGPALYLVDNVEAPKENAVWFSNGHPQIVRCFKETPKGPDRLRACGTYYKSPSVSPPPSLSPSPSHTK